MAEIAFFHMEAIGFLFIVYQTVWNTRIIWIELESIPFQFIYKFLVVWQASCHCFIGGINALYNYYIFDFIVSGQKRSIELCVYLE